MKKYTQPPLCAKKFLQEKKVYKNKNKNKKLRLTPKTGKNRRLTKRYNDMNNNSKYISED